MDPEDGDNLMEANIRSRMKVVQKYRLKARKLIYEYRLITDA